MGLGMGSRREPWAIMRWDSEAHRQFQGALIADAALVSASIVLGNHSTNADVGNKTATLRVARHPNQMQHRRAPSRSVLLCLGGSTDALRDSVAIAHRRLGHCL